jgi:hypothetical protein
VAERRHRAGSAAHAVLTKPGCAQHDKLARLCGARQFQILLRDQEQDMGGLGLCR